MQDIQFHPVTDRALHIDFYQISNDKPVVIEIPVKLNGFVITSYSIHYTKLYDDKLSTHQKIAWKHH